jgi:ACS family sodium-dependent inorganic phosphate cotransporter
MQTIGLMGPALFLSIVSFVHHPIAAVLCMALALGLGSFAQSGVYANHQDIGPEYAGVLLGISNSFAAIPGIVGVALTGFILDKTNGAWSIVFGLAIGFYVLGTIVYNTMGTGERVF